MMRAAATVTLAIFLSGTMRAAGAESPTRPVGAAAAAVRATSLDQLSEQARARVGSAPRVPLAEASGLGWPELAPELRQGHSEAPSWFRAFSGMPGAAQPFAELVHAVLYRGRLAVELKAAMGLRMAQVNGSPYVAAHMIWVLRGSPVGRAVLKALRPGVAGLQPEIRLDVEHAEALTLNVHGVSRAQFQMLRGSFDDSDIVELTLTVAFFNYFTRYAEALHLPVELWVLEGAGPTPEPSGADAQRPRVALISDDEIAATTAAVAAVKEQAGRPGGWGIGLANSQRAMLRAPALGAAWRQYGAATRAKETVGRDVKLQVSLAVSLSNGCRYCTLHQVLGLHRLGVDPGKLVALRKDDAALTPRERSAVSFARKLTSNPGGLTDADYAGLRAEFGEVGALEVVQQTCNFAFMNRFTDGLELPSEDEAIRVYREVYGGDWKKESALGAAPPVR